MLVRGKVLYFATIMDTTETRPTRSKNEDNFPTFSLGLEFLTEAEIEKHNVHYQVMEHSGSLESTQEASVALGYHLGQLLRFFHPLQTSRMLHNSIVHAKA